MLKITGKLGVSLHNDFLSVLTLKNKKNYSIIRCFRISFILWIVWGVLYYVWLLIVVLAIITLGGCRSNFSIKRNSLPLFRICTCIYVFMSFILTEGLLTSIHIPWLLCHIDINGLIKLVSILSLAHYYIGWSTKNLLKEK